MNKNILQANNPTCLNYSAINSAKENKIDNVVFEYGDMKNVFTNDFILKHGKP